MGHQHLSQTKNSIAQPQSQTNAIARSSAHPVEELQSAIGNRAVNKLLANQPTLQAKPMFGGLSRELRSTVEKHPNQTGLPDALKSGAEHLGSVSLDDVKVHYNSDKPAQLNTLAYTQGSDIHVGPGQEQHLPHEAWHVVQQAQGRVKPTMQMKDGVLVNDDEGLEHEADVMGAKVAGVGSAITHSSTSQDQIAREKSSPLVDGQVQWTPVMQQKIDPGKLKKKKTPDSTKRKVLTKIDEYNTIEKQTAKTGTERAQQGNNLFAKLKEIDLEIYAWFDNVSGKHDQLADDPDYKIMREVLDATQSEHIKLIVKFKYNSDVTPFSTSAMDVSRKQLSKKTWRSLVNKAGMIQSIGSSDFDNEMLSHMAKMMDTDIGRDLLTYLDTPLKKADEKDDFKKIYLGENIEQLPKIVRETSINDKLQDISYSGSQAIGSKTDTLKSLKAHDTTTAMANYPALVLAGSATDVTHHAMMGSGGVTYAGKEYDFGTGTGSYVTLSRGGSSVLAGPNNKEILGPKFITLAHELGHSAHTKAGAASDTVEDIMKGIGGFRTPKEAEDVWSNSEEFNNINNVENPMRAQSGMTTNRIGHKDPAYLKLVDLLKTPNGKQDLEDAYTDMVTELESIVSKMAEKTEQKGSKWLAFKKWIAQVQDRNIQYLNPSWLNEMRKTKQKYKKMVGIK